ncbi:hypothetical protein ACFWUZ_01680 [Streptomyces sp. NPDC058646]
MQVKTLASSTGTGAATAFADFLRHVTCRVTGKNAGSRTTDAS